MKVLVVGGGTAGFISAIILKRFLNSDVDIVYSNEIGTIGVGEGSTEHFAEFMKFANIDQYSLIKECDATYKCGINFINWSDQNYLHYVGSPFNSKFGQYNFIYGRQISNNLNYIHPTFLLDNKIPKWYLNKNDSPPFNQYHFNSLKLIEFLKKIAISWGVNIFEDNITNINVSSNGYIESIDGESTKYNYDFYIDATGFKKLLISKIGAKWQSYNKYLKMNSAVVFQTPDENNYNLWTSATAMKYGWMFKIPVWGRHGNGYIFDKNYINADDAKEEISSYLNKDINFGKEFQFDPGQLDKFWINNCCAVGLSAAFVEPLEASSIATTIQQTFLLMHNIRNFNNKTIDSYNKSINSIMENIRDFIILHYLTDKKDTDLWIDLANIELPDSLQEKLDIWQKRLPIKEDFDQSNYLLFTDSNFISVLNGLNLLNKNEVAKEYNKMHSSMQCYATDIVDNYLNEELNYSFFSHKEIITLIRNYM